MKRAKDAVAWVKTNNRFPSAYGKSDEETTLGQWMSSQRYIVQGKGKGKENDRTIPNVYQDVIDLLDDQIPGWRNPREVGEMEKASNFLNWVKTHERFPKKKSEGEERVMWIWFRNRDSVMRRNQSLPFPSVEAFIRDQIYPLMDDPLANV